MSGYGDRNGRHLDGKVCDKAWHLDGNPPIPAPAAHVLQCSCCTVVYARCEQCERTTSVRTSMRAHFYARHQRDHGLESRVLPGRRGKERP